MRRPPPFRQLPNRESLAPLPRESPTHLGYSDESSWNSARYRSLALVTGQAEVMAEIESSVSTSLDASNVRELAWKSLSSAKHRFAAIKVCDEIATAANRQRLRVDVLIWDTHDSRHDVRGRDDSENLARMYYHLMSNAINLRWNAAGFWLVNADERNDMDWQTLEDCLHGRTKREKTAQQQWFPDLSPVRTARLPRVVQVSSSDQPLVQVADLFAGLATFSWNQSTDHRSWKQVGQEIQAGQQNMFSSLGTGTVSNSAMFKHEVLDHVTGLRLSGVAMKAHDGEGLRTYGPKNAINFWSYEPRHASDKAPRKNIA